MSWEGVSLNHFMSSFFSNNSLYSWIEAQEPGQSDSDLQAVTAALDWTLNGTFAFVPTENAAFTLTLGFKRVISTDSKHDLHAGGGLLPQTDDMTLWIITITRSGSHSFRLHLNDGFCLWERFTQSCELLTSTSLKVKLSRRLSLSHFKQTHLYFFSCSDSNQTLSCHLALQSEFGS